jgi:putative phosphoribosyl transferase
VRVEAAGAELQGDLVVPATPRGAVLFAHGTGSGRHSPRNRFVAESLNDRGLATLLVDLLTEAEEVSERQTGHLRFDVGLLAERLEAAMGRLADEPETAALPLGLFGASTGAAAALLAAARQPDRVRAVVSRGGRPDLAGDALRRVAAPTLLIVGGRDPQVLDLNRQALEALGERGKLEVVPGASHLFEESGTLEQVAELAGEWFERHVGVQAS